MIPSRPGHIFLPLTLAFYTFESKAGTQTAPGNIVVGQNGTANYFNGAISSNANVNALVAFPSIDVSSAFIATSLTQLFPGVPVFFNINLGAVGTGGFALTGRLCLLGIWINAEVPS